MEEIAERVIREKGEIIDLLMVLSPFPESLAELPSPRRPLLSSETSAVKTWRHQFSIFSFSLYRCNSETASYYTGGTTDGTVVETLGRQPSGICTCLSVQPCNSCSSFGAYCSLFYGVFPRLLAFPYVLINPAHSTLAD